MLERIKRWKTESKTRRELEALSDRDLRDIGIERQDIKWIVAQTR